MADGILASVMTPFKQPFAEHPGVFITLGIAGLVVGFGLGRLPGAYRRRMLEKRLRDAKERVRQAEADGRRFAELLGVTANGRSALARLSNDQLRAKTNAFVSALHAQLAAWKKEIEGRLAHRPAPLAAAAAQEADQAWNEVAKGLLKESASRLAAYRDRFKVDAVLLRTEISRRLDRPAERSTEAVTRVPSPVSLSAMEKVADDLDALAKLLPDDVAARALSAERRRRVRRRA